MNPKIQKCLKQLAVEIEKELVEELFDSEYFGAGAAAMIHKLDGKYGKETTTFFAIEILARLVQQQRISARAIFYATDAKPGDDPILSTELNGEFSRGDDGEDRNWLFGTEKVFGYDIAFTFQDSSDRD